MEDGDGGGSRTGSGATDDVTATLSGSGSETDDGEWVCPSTVAESPWCYDRIALLGIEQPWAGVPVELGEGRGTGLAVFHKAGSDPVWNGGPVSLVAWEDGELIVTHGDFANPDNYLESDYIRAVRLSGNPAEDLVVYNRVEGESFIELLLLEEDRWTLVETAPVVLPNGYDLVGVPVLARDSVGAPILLLVERNVGFRRLMHGEGAWMPTGEIIPLPAGLPDGGSAQEPSYGDVDGDDDEDVLVSFFDVGGGEDRRLGLLLAKPTAPAGFEFVDLGSMADYSHLVLGDFDGDGWLDILEFGGYDSFRFGLRRGHGNGMFDAPVSGDVSLPHGSGVGVAGDINGDGMHELLVSNYDANPGLGMMEHLEAGGAYRLLVGSSSEDPISAADVNSDGQLDIITGDGDRLSTFLISLAPEL